VRYTARLMQFKSLKRLGKILRHPIRAVSALQVGRFKRGVDPALPTQEQWGEKEAGSAGPEFLSRGVVRVPLPPLAQEQWGEKEAGSAGQEIPSRWEGQGLPIPPHPGQWKEYETTQYLCKYQLAR
jgi:hypothetical protein